MSSIHEYKAQVAWTGSRQGEGGLRFEESGLGLDLAVPTEYGGRGGATNPEELLTGAIVSCYSITLGIIAENRKLPIQSIDVEAVGEVEQAGASLVYRKITLRPQIVANSGSSEAQVAAITEDGP